jgi:hypothetical protein
LLEGITMRAGSKAFSGFSVNDIEEASEPDHPPVTFTILSSRSRTSSPPSMN